MKVQIEADECTGCNLCAVSCPDVFEMSDTIAIVIKSDIADDLSDLQIQVRELADSCPAEAITLY